MTWDEAVELSTGRVINVHRETYHRPGGAELAVGSGWRPIRYLIRFEYPFGSGRTIEWRSKKMAAERGTDPEFPLLLDFAPESNAPYVITFRGLRGACYEYVRYVYRHGAWVEDPLPRVFMPYRANLYLGAAGLGIPSYVRLERERKRNADLTYSIRFKRIGSKRMDCRA